MRRNTDRRTIHRLPGSPLPVTLLPTAKILDRRDRWVPGTVPIGWGSEIVDLQKCTAAVYRFGDDPHWPVMGCSYVEVESKDGLTIHYGCLD
jgi:hypothetical protein